ncbi:Laccase domain protein [Halomicronema hongdechloris C2206]|uniref:Purine nucleoside phosphorylase n=1 Tax=Halomicronema hongdechloris C2206 TaxID=1641165 RepID=A0A1Z3HUS9_9CYAN|nr:peptidoglycan editing factor PgeF [Halomicronema hongdechloris]ASC74022.1 Laccase domain protein [Halomicronema hongdechloris C2206]
MHTWHWQHWQGLPYLTCSLLSEWPHGFFTQQFWPRAPETMVAALREQAPVYRVRQVHGNRVLGADEVALATRPLDLKTVQRPEADALVSTQPWQAMWVCTADCNPVLIADGRSGHVAAVHAGWRGTAQQVVPQAIRRLQTQGSRLADLRVAMGPAIAGKMYQVSTPVALEVGRSIVAMDVDEDPDTFLVKVQALTDSPIGPDPTLGRFRLDVRRANLMQLMHLGIALEQVAIAPHCTYQEPQHFFSYRRSREKKVQWSGIVSTASPAVA